MSAPWWNPAQREREAKERARLRDEQEANQRAWIRTALAGPDAAAVIVNLSPFAPVSATEVMRALAAEVVRLQERVAQLEAG